MSTQTDSPVIIQLSDDEEAMGGDVTYPMKDGNTLANSVDTMSLDDWAQAIDANNKAKGWNDDRDPAEWAALAHSEISEFYEEHRNGYSPTEIYFSDGNKPEGQAIEMADVLIRTLHWFARHNLNPNRLIALKMQYNTTRPFRHGDKRA